MPLFGSRRPGLKKFYAGAVPETATLVSAQPCNLLGLQFENNHSTVMYLQFFDADDAGDVTVGTTTPVWTVMVPAGDGLFLPPRSLPLHHFSGGLVIAATASRTGNESVTGKPTVSLYYVQE